ncbi:MAG TPA: hypothetical protein VEB00_02415 [Clostridia bacterium]|nr:hypothetical protein [Clostridia bacterium]
MIAYDENGEEIKDVVAEKVEYEFILHPRTEEIKKALNDAGTDDIHILCEKCYETMKSYFEFYSMCIKKKKKK